MSSANCIFFLLFDNMDSKSIWISHSKIFFDEIYFGKEGNISKE